MTPTYMLTLCRLSSPVAITPPEAPELKKFEFFTSRSRHADGERLHLHMGYFTTAVEAHHWARLMRRNYPHAIATRVPEAILNRRNSRIPTLQPAEAQQPAQRMQPAQTLQPAQTQQPAPALQAAQSDSPPLTDTQVLNILETRRVSPLAHERPDTNSSGISLLRPEDTNTRRILREAVARNTPVSFALQLLWSAQPIDPSTVPLVSIFRAHTLYCAEMRRESRAWYSIRLGFFNDAISAKQVAAYVRSSFASVAVVPVTEDERAHAANTRIDTTSLTDTFNQTAPAPAAPAKPRPTAAPKEKDSLEQTLELLASREVWDNDDSLSETGVRHLTIQVQKRSAGR